MVEVSDLVTPVSAALSALPGITFYDGYVPESIPETGGYIDPYIVLWAGIGDNPNDLTACGTQGTDTLIWDFQITVVGADPAICRAVAATAAAALTNLRVRTGKVRRNPDGFDQSVPLMDTQTTPARFMLPLQWRLITN